MPYGFYGFDPTYLLILPALFLAMWAQGRVSTNFARYSRVPTQRGTSGAAVARELLDLAGLQNVAVQQVPGSLTDHYSPKDHSLALSDAVFANTSVAAVGVAAHEVGHAIQHKEGYGLLALRDKVVPFANIGTMAAFPLFLIGLMLRGQTLMTLGIVLYAGVFVFHLVTLPVEIDATNRALKLLDQTGQLNAVELEGARKVLRAAGWTYIAATLMAALQLLRLLLIRKSYQE